MQLPTLKDIVEKSDTPAGRAFDLTIQFLIVVSLVTCSLETLPSLDQSSRNILRFIEVVTVIIFTAEYLLRFAVAERKSRFAFSFYGVIDLFSILPFYVSAGVDLRSVRAFRLLRLFRIFKIVRYSKAIRRFHRALLIAREELVLYLFVTLILFYLAAVGIYYFERDAQPKEFASVFHSMW